MRLLFYLISFPFSVYTEFAFTLIGNAIVVNPFYGLLDARCAYHRELLRYTIELYDPRGLRDCINKKEFMVIGNLLMLRSYSISIVIIVIIIISNDLLYVALSTASSSNKKNYKNYASLHKLYSSRYRTYVI